MEICKDSLIGAELGDLLAERFLDLYDQFRFGEDLRCVIDDLCTRCLVRSIAEPAPCSGPAFKQHGIPVPSQKLNSDGQQSHPILINLDLTRYADNHCSIPFAGVY